MAIAVDSSNHMSFAAELVGRPSATFLRLEAYSSMAAPAPGVYVGTVQGSAGAVPCAITILADGVTVWCQPRAPLPPVAVGQGVRLTASVDSWTQS
ncbi:MAG TPA: hypothetical protein VNT55_18935 [Baekduia sp.]|nr:hypothetical protein [Baekduia sp.]